MVEVRRYIVAVVVALSALSGLAGAGVASGQQRQVIAGLEENAQYRQLIEEEGVLVRRADSIDRMVAGLRRDLRTDTLARTTIAAAIVMAEEEAFKLRSQMARIASRINTIEQGWIMQQLLVQPETEEVPQREAMAVRHARNLVYSSWFEAGLTPGELIELRAAQQAERRLPEMVAHYRDGHGRLAELARRYEGATRQGEADSIMVRFEEMKGEVVATEQSIGERWEKIFDDKSYLYNLLAEKEGREGLLERFEGEMVKLREVQSRWSGRDVPAALLDYVLRKRSLVDYETAIAQEIGNGEAADSLRGVAAALPGPESLEGLGAVEITERLFIDYAEVAVGRSPYSIANPIPELAVPPKGIVWRVLVGSFAARPSLSVFRGVSPLAVQATREGRLRYFAGGFETDSMARAAVEVLTKAGFRAPEAVVWMDGVYVNPEAEGEEGEKVYRMEIAGVEALPAQVREAIERAKEGTGADIAHAEGVFIVAPMEGRAAVALRSELEAMKGAYPKMAVRLGEIEAQ